jgi:hypothetical protein
VFVVNGFCEIELAKILPNSSMRASQPWRPIPIGHPIAISARIHRAVIRP